MNKRIRELALQAGGSHYPEVNAMQLEKFAELIVKECMLCCERVISDPVRPESVDTWLNGGLSCIDEIKEHFGVEE